MKNRIFFIDPMSYHNLEIYDRNLIKYLVNDDIFFFGNKKLTVDINARLYLIYSYSDKVFFLKILSYFLSQVQLIYYIFKKRPYVVHFQWFKIPFFDFLVLKIIKFFFPNLKIVFTAHNVLPHNTGGKFISIYGKIYKIVHSIIVHDQKSKKEICFKFNVLSEKVNVIQHGVLDLSFDKSSVDMMLRSVDKNNKLYFLFLGSLSKYKGIDVLIDTWASYSQLNSNKELVLIIAGSGNFPDLDKLNVFNNVIVINKFLSNEDFMFYLKLSDVIVMPYRKISQSGILLTAINEKKPVIVSRVGGLTQPFDLTSMGWIIDSVDKESLFCAINKAKLAFQEDKDVFLKSINWEILYRFYSWKEIAKKTHDVYVSAI